MYLLIYHKKPLIHVDYRHRPMDQKNVWERRKEDVFFFQVKASMSKINEELHRDETSPPLLLGASKFISTKSTLQKHRVVTPGKMEG